MGTEAGIPLMHQLLYIPSRKNSLGFAGEALNHCSLDDIIHPEWDENMKFTY
jgi:hypothetical protein